MARIPPVDDAAAAPEAREAASAHAATGGRMTNMKWTLAHSPAAFRALMEWYPLRDEVQPFLGERRTWIFCHAISSENDCLVCSTFFRRLLIDAGEDPESLELDDLDELVVAYGRRLATDPHGVDDELYARLAERFDEREIVLLTAFGAIMVATNVFNDALGVDLDGYLEPYRGAAST
jgi:alkylhydroperoxidase family enzyme